MLVQIDGFGDMLICSIGLVIANRAGGSRSDGAV